jgi:zinc protease
MPMINRTTLFAAASAALLLASSAATARKERVPPHPSKLQFEPLTWEVPSGEPYRHVLGDSLVAYIAQDRALPRVVVVGHVRYGSLSEPSGKEGLTSLLCAMMRSGGVKGIPADTLDMLLDLHAISVRLVPSDSRIEFGASFLSEYTDTAMALLTKMLFTPAFEPARMEKERAALAESIRHRFDDPGPTLSVAYSKAMYPGTALSRMATLQTVANLSREDLLEVHRRAFSRRSIIVGASGDFDSDSMLALVDRLFPRDTASGQAVVFPEVSINPANRLVLVPKKTTQAYVRMSLPMFQRPHPDYYACSVLNHVLGGGSFSSRLNASVRSDAGLTYSIYSSVVSSYVYPGTFFVNFFTKTESTVEAMRLVVKEIEKIRAEGVTAEELESAKKVLVDGLPSMFRSKEDIVEHYTWNEYYGRDIDTYRNYPDSIAAITANDVLSAATRYLHPDSLTYVVVADTAALSRADTMDGFSLKTLAPALVVPPDSLQNLP